MHDRIEHDSLGEVRVPADAFYGAQTQRAIDNFRLSGLTMPRAFIRALGLVKGTAAEVNAALGLLDPRRAQAIRSAADRVAGGELDRHFPVDVFQTGSGTSTNMNANEVIAHCASQALDEPVHPNDHVNMSQSSNDVIPSAIHVAAALLVQETLLPGLESLAACIEARAGSLGHVVKTGRTHLMDAMPLTVAQELSGWAEQVRQMIERIAAVQPRLHALALGGTAVGTGVNAPAAFGPSVAAALAQRTGVPFVTSRNFFAALSSQDTAVELSGQLKAAAVGLMKIANDLRWMVCAQVVGNDAAITIAGQSGSFQLNVMLPLVAYDLLQSVELTGRAARLLGERAIADMVYDEPRLREQLDRNPILVTGLNKLIGYEQGAKIARRAYAEGRAIIDVAAEMTGMPRSELERLLDPFTLTRAGVPE
jgi:fumarate hydratase class II